MSDCAQTLKGFRLTQKETSSVVDQIKQVNFVGTWDYKDGVLLDTSIGHLIQRRSNLTGVTLMNVVLSASPLFDYWTGDVSTSVILSNGSNAKGINVPVLQALQERLGFDTFHMEPPDDYFGHLWPNGTWSGIVGQLINGKCRYISSLAYSHA